MPKKLINFLAKLFSSKSIKTELLILLLVVIPISIIIISYLGVSSVISIGNNAQEITSLTLRSQAERFLSQLTKATAEKNNLIFQEISIDASNVADYAKNIFEHPQVFVPGAHWRFDDHIFRGNQGQYLNGKDDVSSVFIPNHIAITDDLKKRVELSAFLEFIFPQVLKNKPNAVAIWIVGPEGESRYYPNIGLGNIVPPDEKVTEEVFFTVANPENNPERKVVWTPVYDDPAAQGLMITASTPIYTKQKGFWGVLGIDITLETIIKNIEEYTPIEDADSFIIGEDGYAIALSEEAYKDLFGKSLEKKESQVNLNGVTNELDSVIDEMKKGAMGFKIVNLWGKEQYIAYAPLESTKFSLGIFVEKEMMLKAVTDLQKEVKNSTWKMIFYRILPISSFILVGIWLAVFWYVNRRVIKPLRNLTKTAEEISGGKLGARSDIVSENEIGQLASTFNQMASQLQKYYSGLEQKVKERTAETEESKKQLEVVNVEIQKKLEELERTNNLMVGRELKMTEMKKEIEELKKKVNEA